MNRWSLWHSVVGLLIVVVATVGLWGILRHPAASTGPTALERKAQRLDELCRMVDTEIKIGQTWRTDPDASPRARATLQVLGRLATVCHWTDTRPEAP
jgi:hypothetical protein